MISTLADGHAAAHNEDKRGRYGSKPDEANGEERDQSARQSHKSVVAKV
jgi:hypothetical protein